DRAGALGYPPEAIGRLRGLVLARAGRPEAAEPLLRSAWEHARGPDPEVAEALARIYLETFRLDRAAAVLDRWAREVPADPRPCLWRTEVDTRTGVARP